MRSSRPARTPAVAGMTSRPLGRAGRSRRVPGVEDSAVSVARSASRPQLSTAAIPYTTLLVRGASMAGSGSVRRVVPMPIQRSVWPPPHAPRRPWHVQGDQSRATSGCPPPSGTAAAWSAGDRVLLATHPQLDLLVVHPPPALDRLLDQCQTEVLGGDLRVTTPSAAGLAAPWCPAQLRRSMTIAMRWLAPTHIVSRPHCSSWCSRPPRSAWACRARRNWHPCQ